MIIDGYGNIGIGTTTPAEKLDVLGTIQASNYKCSSDVRYKKDISPYQNALEKVLGLRGVNYFWRADEFKDNNFSKDKQIGFIAQEVEKVIPELVYTDDKGYKTMSYDRLTAVLVEAVKELKSQSDAKISTLEQESQKKISALELKNAALKHKLAKIESMVTALEKSVAQNKVSPEDRNGNQKKLAAR